MPTYAIAGKTVVITGAAGGIGAAAARAPQARGANVVLADLGLDAASALAREIGGDRALAVTVDVTDTAALADAVARTVDRFGSLDVLFANAGIAADPPATMATIDEATFERVVQVDCWESGAPCAPHCRTSSRRAGTYWSPPRSTPTSTAWPTPPTPSQRPASNSSAGPCAPNSPSTAPPPGCSTSAGSAHPSPGSIVLVTGLLGTVQLSWTRAVPGSAPGDRPHVVIRAGCGESGPVRRRSRSPG
jgi:NAD(P)-dependent dehydrogenase (short-subunit alcohol dehydrogenase family)